MIAFLIAKRLFFKTSSAYPSLFPAYPIFVSQLVFHKIGGRQVTYEITI